MKYSPIVASAFLVLALAACSSTPSADNSQASAKASATEVSKEASNTASQTASAKSNQQAFPVTVTVPGSKPTTIKERPVRIAALSPDVAIALHELGLTERIIAIPAAATNSALNPYAKEMTGIKDKFSAENTPEPEKIVSWKPDLVIITARHTGEKDATSRLTATGIPVLALTNGWSSTENIVQNLELIGKATGASDAASVLAKDIRDGVAQVKAKSATAAKKPSVAILSNQAHVPFINAADSMVSELVANGGGENLAGKIGAKRTMPIQPEQLLAANPDYIMLVDVMGKGEASFDSVLKNPAVANLPAVKDGKVRVFAGKDVYGIAGKEAVSGSKLVLSWLHPELAK